MLVSGFIRPLHRPLSENGVRTALRSLGYTNEQMTPHGFRAMGRTLLDEELNYRLDWIERGLLNLGERRRTGVHHPIAAFHVATGCHSNRKSENE